MMTDVNRTCYCTYVVCWQSLSEALERGLIGYPCCSNMIWRFLYFENIMPSFDIAVHADLVCWRDTCLAARSDL